MFNGFFVERVSSVPNRQNPFFFHQSLDGKLAGHFARIEVAFCFFKNDNIFVPAPGLVDMISEITRTLSFFLICQWHMPPSISKSSPLRAASCSIENII